MIRLSRLQRDFKISRYCFFKTDSETYECFDFLIIKDREAFVVLDFLNCWFLDLEGPLTMLGLLNPVEGCSIFLEDAALTAD